MNSLARDLDAVLEPTGRLWEELRGARLFVTGGSGFFGRWVLESLAWAEGRHRLGTNVTVLTRDARRFRERLPQVNCELIEGDVRTIPSIPGAVTHLIHMAAEPHGPRYALQPDDMHAIVVGGTHRVFTAARAAGVRRALLISSGAVYGPQPSHEKIPDDALPGEENDAARQAYSASKAAAEYAAMESQVPVAIARPFAFLGPHLPADTGFAAGRFIADAVAGRNVRVQDGTVVRSYLYAADLAVWLWTILLRGQPSRAYNVGSEHAITLKALAGLIAGAVRPLRDVECGWATTGHRYVPSTERARTELGLTETVSLPEAIRRTIRWHRETANAPPGR